jgi:hypothetical protein
MSEDEAAESSQALSLGGFSSLFSISSSTTPHPHHHVHQPLPSLPLGMGTGGDEEEDQVVSSGQATTARVRMMRNRESALRSRARKRAYVQELEKEVRRLADDNLRLKRQFRQVLYVLPCLLPYLSSVSALLASLTVGD